MGSLIYAQVYCFCCEGTWNIFFFQSWDRTLDSCKENNEILIEDKNFKLVLQKIYHLKVIGYIDADLLMCFNDQNSTSGYVFVLAGGVVYLKSAKQTLVALSIMRTKFVAFYGAATQATQLNNFISRLLIVNSIQKSITIYCDNSAIVFLSKIYITFSGSKHIKSSILQSDDTMIFYTEFHMFA